MAWPSPSCPTGSASTYSAPARTSRAPPSRAPPEHLPRTSPRTSHRFLPSLGRYMLCLALFHAFFGYTTLAVPLMLLVPLQVPVSIGFILAE